MLKFYERRKCFSTSIEEVKGKDCGFRTTTPILSHIIGKIYFPKIFMTLRRDFYDTSDQNGGHSKLTSCKFNITTFHLWRDWRTHLKISLLYFFLFYRLKQGAPQEGFLNNIWSWPQNFVYTFLSKAHFRWCYFEMIKKPSGNLQCER